jgi:enamine deaminase RidA (YjgF/YER057c/UK114 family)
MPRRLITGHSPYEPVAGFSRAVVDGRHVHVAGTAPIPPDGGEPPSGAYEQTRLCLDLIVRALEQAGAGAGDVVRTRMYLTDPADFEDVARAHGETFRDVRPASTAVVVSLLDPRWKVELEAEALIPEPREREDRAR